MKEVIFDKVGADDPLQALKEFGEQWMNFFSGVQQMLEENEQLRQRVAQQDEKIEMLEEKNAEQENKNAELEMRLSELSKLTGGVAR